METVQEGNLLGITITVDWMCHELMWTNIFYCIKAYPIRSSWTATRGASD